MSCTVVAIPFALAPLIASIAGTAIASAAGFVTTETSGEIEFVNENELDNINTNCDDNRILRMSHLTSKTFETQFMDKDILIKTLEEHGVCDIKESVEGDVTGIIDNYAIKFSKPNADKPYTITINANEDANIEEKVEDIKSEYTLNVQEAAYLSIVDKLKENNMQIEEETVEDDNTIVLTINLE